MRILYISPSYWPAFRYGGPVFTVYSRVKSLVKKGIDVTVYTTTAGLPNNKQGMREEELEGARVKYFACPSYLEYFNCLGYIYTSTMAKELEATIHSFDLLHIISVWGYTVSLAAEQAINQKIPYIVSPSGSLNFRLLKGKYWRKKVYYNLYMKRYIENASAIHYATELEALSHVELKLQNKPVIIPNGFDLSELKDLPKKNSFSESFPYTKGKKIILYIGRIHWIKGLDILADAFCRLLKDKNDVHLFISGQDTGEYSKKLKQIFKRSGVVYSDSSFSEVPYDAKVTFTGIVSGEKKREILLASDIFVMPSRYESFGRSALEAMAYGIPTILSNRVGISHQVKEARAGIVVDDDQGSILEAMKYILDDHSVKESLSVKGANFVKDNYNSDELASKMITLYEEAILAKS